MNFGRSGEFRSIGSDADAAAARVTHSGVRRIVRYRLIVGVGQLEPAYVGYGAVVHHPAISPRAPDKPSAEVSMAVVDPSIKADMRAPISCPPRERSMLYRPKA